MTASLIKWNKGGLKNPMARARGLGASGGAAHHWVMQRLSAVLLLPLTAWLCWSVVGLAGANHAAFVLWLAKPWNAVLMLLSVVAMFYHAALGAQVVIEDYVHTPAIKLASLAAMKIILFAASVACIFAILKVAL